MGFSQDRQLTQTGGLTFAGGPLNNYVTHSIAAMIETLRANPGDVGLVSANGGFLTKHAIGLYSTNPSATPYQAADVQDVVDQVAPTDVDPDYAGPATVEAYTVMHNSEGPEVGLCAVRTPAGARTWGRVTDMAAASSMMVEEAIGRDGNLAADGVLTLN